MAKPHRRFMLPLLATLLVAAMLLFATDALACPNCKAAVPEFPQTGATDGGAAVTPDMATGYFWSILFMISVPFALVTAMGATFYVTLRRSGHVNHPDA